MKHQFNKSKFKEFKESISTNVDQIISDIYSHMITFEEYELFITNNKIQKNDIAQSWNELENKIKKIKTTHYQLQRAINDIIKSDINLNK
jgi:hypothetical protein